MRLCWNVLTSWPHQPPTFQRRPAPENSFAMRFSIVVPLYNRPEEIRLFLESLRDQPYRDFEVLVVEDGSKLPAQEITESYADHFPVRYFYKANEGPGFTRNYGFERAQGDIILVFDSDVILPPHYFEAVDRAFAEQGTEAFGGPDKAAESFNAFTKAMNYSMTALLTTGGIRGSNHGGTFYPRSFNMGFTRQVYETTGGFRYSHLGGEDIDLSARIMQQGFQVDLIPEAYVYHKRKSTLRKFFKQTYNFGKKRIDVYRMHPHTLKLTHFFPSVFTLYLASCVILPFLWLPWSALWAAPLVAYLLAILMDSSFRNRSLWVGLLSVATSVTQHLGYGLGFLRQFVRRVLLGKGQ